MSQDLTTQIREKTEQIHQLANELKNLFEQQTAELSEVLLGKYIQIKGEKGWNKGMVVEVRKSGLNYISIEHPQLSSRQWIIKVDNYGQSKTVYDPNNIRLLSDEEVAVWKKSMALDRKINERGLRS